MIGCVFWCCVFAFLSVFFFFLALVCLVWFVAPFWLFSVFVDVLVLGLFIDFSGLWFFLLGFFSGFVFIFFWFLFGLCFRSFGFYLVWGVIVLLFFFFCFLGVCI